MPILKEHQELIKHNHADITNSPGKPNGGSSQAAAFLQRFVEKDVNWAHLDIAGTAGDKEGTGYGAQLLINFIRNL